MKALRPLIVFDAETDVMEAIRPQIGTRLTLTAMQGPRYVWQSSSAGSRLPGIACCGCPIGISQHATGWLADMRRP